MILGDSESFDDNRCPKTGAFLASQIALVGATAKGCAELFQLTSDVTGMPIIQTTVDEYQSGGAVEKLLDECCGVFGWLHSGALLVNGYCDSREARFATIFVCSELPTAAANVRVICVE